MVFTKSVGVLTILIFWTALMRATERQGAEPMRTPAPPGVHSAANPAAQAVLSSLLRKHAAYRDFRARFMETPVSRGTGVGVEESGLVFFQRPGRWRWEYRHPERKVVVVNGKIATVSIDGESEVSSYDLTEADQSEGIALILDGGDRSADSFSAQFEQGSEPGGPELLLRLDPVTLSDQFDHIVVRIRRKDLVLLAVTVVDPGGNELRFRFEDFRADVGFDKDLFETKVQDPRAAAPRNPASSKP